MKVVEVGEVKYVLSSVSKLEKKADPCYWCAAYNNMMLCNRLCGGCDAYGDFVFIRKI